MAGNELRRRVITGAGIGLVIIVCTLAGTIPSLLLILAIVAGSCIEYFRLQRAEIRKRASIVEGVFSIVPVLVTFSLLVANPRIYVDLSVTFLASLLVVLTAYLLFQFRAAPELLRQRLYVFSLSLFLFTVPGFFALIMISQEGARLLLGMFILLWCSDIFAYFGGRAFGKRKLIRSISPNKTWEGLLCGLAAAVLAALGLSYLFTEIHLMEWLVTAILVVVFGVLGDLTQSVIKRAAGVKDSGNIFPGHGGVWDRFDSFLGCVAWVGMCYILF